MRGEKLIMNDLINVYQKMSMNSELFSKYTSIAKDGYGCMFQAIINTNYRAILSPVNKLDNQYGYGGFAQGFSVLERVEGKDRNEWLENRANHAGQEVEKQPENSLFFSNSENKRPSRK